VETHQLLLAHPRNQLFVLAFQLLLLFLFLLLLLELHLLLHPAGHQRGRICLLCIEEDVEGALAAEHLAQFEGVRVLALVLQAEGERVLRLLKQACRDVVLGRHHLVLLLPTLARSPVHQHCLLLLLELVQALGLNLDPDLRPFQLRRLKLSLRLRGLRKHNVGVEGGLAGQVLFAEVAREVELEAKALGVLALDERLGPQLHQRSH